MGTSDWCVANLFSLSSFLQTTYQQFLIFKFSGNFLRFKEKKKSLLLQCTNRLAGSTYFIDSNYNATFVVTTAMLVWVFDAAYFFTRNSRIVIAKATLCTWLEESRESLVYYELCKSILRFFFVLSFKNIPRRFKELFWLVFFRNETPSDFFKIRDNEDTHFST